MRRHAQLTMAPDQVSPILPTVQARVAGCARSELARVSFYAAPLANNFAVLDQREEQAVVLAPIVIRAYEGQDNLASLATDPERTAVAPICRDLGWAANRAGQRLRAGVAITPSARIQLIRAVARLRVGAVARRSVHHEQHHAIMIRPAPVHLGPSKHLAVKVPFLELPGAFNGGSELDQRHTLRVQARAMTCQRKQREQCQDE